MQWVSFPYDFIFIYLFYYIDYAFFDEMFRLLVSHLPCGPTAYFKLSSFEPGAKIPGHGRPTSHIPEIILNNFSTRLGRRIGRFLGSFFPHVSFLCRRNNCNL